MSSYRKKRRPPGTERTEQQNLLTETQYANPGVQRDLSSNQLTSGLPYQRPVEPEDVDRENGLDEKQLQAMIGKVRELSRGKIEAGCRVGVICTDESRHCYTDGAVRSIGERKSQASVAHNLYALLREFDDLGVDYIFSESFPKDHLGQAIMNRLSKAAGYKIVKV